MDNEEQEVVLFHPYPCAYYVQSPSTISHANSTDILRNTTESPLRCENPNHEASRYTLSRYSSSRGSNNSFLHESKKVGYEGTGKGEGGKRLIIIDRVDRDQEEDEDEDEGFGYGEKRGWWWRYCSFRRSNSCVWISLQMSWRILVSLMSAALVFYIATNPSPPRVSVKVAGIRVFELNEGVDTHGVTTKILNCNCTMNLVIENRSKLFGLHIHQPKLEMSFGRLPIAMSHGPKLYAQSNRRRVFHLFVGTRDKPMYGAGRDMQDLLQSGKGLPMAIRVSLSSDYRVVWNLIKPKYRHQAKCLLVLHHAYDKKHRTQAYSGGCKTKS